MEFDGEGIITLTKEEMDAVQVRAMLKGVEVEAQIASEMGLIGYDFSVEVLNKKGRKKSTSGSTKGTRKPKEEPKPKKMDLIEMKDEFSKLPVKIEFEVYFKKHDIHYKDQFWGINERTVPYVLELIKQPKPAKDASDFINGDSYEKRVRAAEGDDRYYKVVSYANIPYKVSSLGYIKVTFKDGELKSVTKLKMAEIKECNADPEAVKKDVVRAIVKELKTINANK